MRGALSLLLRNLSLSATPPLVLFAGPLVGGGGGERGTLGAPLLGRDPASPGSAGPASPSADAHSSPGWGAPGGGDLGGVCTRQGSGSGSQPTTPRGGLGGGVPGHTMGHGVGDGAGPASSPPRGSVAVGPFGHGVCMGGPCTTQDARGSGGGCRGVASTSSGVRHVGDVRDAHFQVEDETYALLEEPYCKRSSVVITLVLDLLLPLGVAGVGCFASVAALTDLANTNGARG